MPCGEGRVVTLLQGIHASTYSTVWEHTASTRCTYVYGGKKREGQLLIQNITLRWQHEYISNAISACDFPNSVRGERDPPQPRENKKVFLSLLSPPPSPRIGRRRFVRSRVGKFESFRIERRGHR